MDWQTSLMTVFVYIWKQYKIHLWPFCQRISNNNNPKFTDEELLAIFINGIMKRRFELKYIYNYAHDHLLEWFSHLSSYVAFIQRLNRFERLFPMLTELILKNDFSESAIIQQIRLIHSMPIILANAKRSSKAKTVNELANKGYCSSKGIYYYGVKLRILGIKRQGTLPLPDYIGLTPARDHDLSAFYIIAPLLERMHIYADKAYIDKIEQQLLEQQQVQVNTPVKKKKDQEKLELFDQLLSTSVSRVQQPIESLFNWIQKKTHIQIASKVRSYNLNWIIFNN